MSRHFQSRTGFVKSASDDFPRVFLITFLNQTPDEAVEVPFKEDFFVAQLMSPFFSEVERISTKLSKLGLLRYMPRAKSGNDRSSAERVRIKTKAATVPAASKISPC
jgi:hypothetical protein